MQFYDVLSLMSEKYTAFQMLWSFYITVTVGLLAYVATTFKAAESRLIRVMLAISFCLFASVNLKGLSNVREQRESLHSVASATYKQNHAESSINPVIEKNKEFQRYLLKARPPRFWTLLLFHILLDLIVVIIILILPGALASAKRIKELNNTSIRNLRGIYEESAVISRNEEKGTWILNKEFDVTTTRDGYRFIIPEGFEFDLASVPRLFWWFIAPFELSIAAPLVHDYYYRNGGNPEPNSNEDENPELTRAQVDLVFRELMKGEGVSRFRRLIAFYGVRMFGGLSWRDKS